MIQEQLNTFVYFNGAVILKGLRYLSLFVSLLTVGVILYFYGFEHPEHENLQILTWAKYLYVYFILSFLLRLIFHLQRWDFIKTNWFEMLVSLLVVLETFIGKLNEASPLNNLLKLMGVPELELVYQAILFLFLLVFVGIKFIKFSQYITNLPIKPSILFIGSFLFIILLGTGLLMLPEMTQIEGSMPFLDALFTSTSSACVTGLIVVDTATYFTVKGQLVILALMQTGGIGIITFGLFFTLILRTGFGLKNQRAAQEFMDTDNLQTAQNLLRQVIGVTLTIELVGTVLMFGLWSPQIDFESFGSKVFHSIFHGVSAFCNAGFSTFTNGLNNALNQESYYLHLVFAVMIFLGGLGFHVIQDLTSIGKLRDRMKYPWKKWELGTKIALFSSIALIVFGALIFYLMEQDGVLEGKNSMEQLITAIFQSVTTRSAGFSTVSIRAVSTPVLIIFIFLMFVGASSASTGGGIKTSTFVIIFMSVFSTIRGKRELEIGYHSISNELLNRAFSIFVFAATYILICVFILSITDPQFTMLRLVFEEVSAFCTVGLSTGITSELSQVGKVVIISSMFVGRVGILTLAVALSTMVPTTAYKYPRARLMIG